MIQPQEIEDTLGRVFPGCTVPMIKDLTGGGDHYQVVIVHDSFAGKGLIDQHKMVYDALKDELGDERIHALSLKTFTPEQWEKFGA